MNSTALTAEILKRHGARPDVRLFRNATAKAFVGKVKGRTRDGNVVLTVAQQIQCGLCIGSADIIGWRTIDGVAVFVALEVKTGGDTLSKEQRAFLATVKKFGGIAAVVRSVEDADEVLGVPPV